MDGYIGEVKLFAGDFAPRNWALCKGQLLSVEQYVSLFAIIGNVYGGDGKVSFALPDLRGRAAIGTGQGIGYTPRTLGSHVGAEHITLNVNQMPMHSHDAVFSESKADLYTSSGLGTSGTPSPGDAISAESGGAGFIYSDGAPDIKMSSKSIQNISAKVTNKVTGGSAPHNNMQPSLVLNYIICLIGLYPSSNDEGEV